MAAPTQERSIAALCRAVQRNCHISDAAHAGGYGMCVYLLKMREYCRWERGLGFDAALPPAAIGAWLSEREALWETLADEEPCPLEFGGRRFDPFDADELNAALLPRGYVYAGGIGARGATHFFLGELLEDAVRDGRRVLISGAECARDLAAPPAMCLGDTIFVRRESLRRHIWERLGEWRWNRPQNFAARAFSFYDFDGDLDGALDAMTDAETTTLILHELGEAAAREDLGPGWREMLCAMPRSRTELLLRAVKDCLADAATTLPRLIERRRVPSLYFYFAGIDKLRASLCPSLWRAAERWGKAKDADFAVLQDALAPAARHWREVARSALALFKAGEPPAAIGEMVSRNAL